MSTTLADVALVADGSLVITKEAFEEMISERLDKITGASFPFPQNKTPYSSKPINDRTINANMQKKFEAGNFKVTRGGNRLNIERDEISWSLENLHLAFVLLWSRKSSGVELLLETEPRCTTGSQEAVVVMSHMLQAMGLNLHPVVCELTATNGVGHYTWEQLGMEPNVTLTECFREFVASFKKATGYIDHLVRDQEHHPFDPNPYFWDEASSRMALDVPALVFESKVRDLHEHWLTQLNAFIDSSFPPRA